MKRLALTSGAAVSLLVAAIVGAGVATAAEPDGDAEHLVPNPLLKEVLSEEEEGEGGGEPAATALCQEFLNRPTPYADPSPNVDIITNDGTVRSGSQTGCTSAQNETHIAVNPFNPRHLVAGANDYRVFSPRQQLNDSSGWAYSSRDGGRTWRNVQLPGLTVQTGATGPLTAMDAAGDPAVAFGPLNTVYYVNLVFSRTSAASGITVNVSRDGGLTWGAPSIVRVDGVRPDGTPVDTPVFNDKPWIAADPRSGRVVVTWTRFVANEDGDFVESPIVLSTSRDFGRTWSASTPVGPTLETFRTGITPFAQGSIPQLARDGTLYVAYEASVCETAECDQPEDHDATVMARSRDNGRTFTLTEIDTNFDFPENEDVGRATLTGENFRINSFPQFAIDALTGKLWVTWADDRNGEYDEDGESVRTNGDVVLASSSNGLDWTVDVVGTRSDEVYPAVAALFDRVAVSTYTREFDPDGIGLDYGYFSGRNGVGPRLNRITTQSQDPRVQFISTGLESGETLQGVFIGDYTAIAIGLDLRIHPIWTDFRGDPLTNKPNQDAYTQSIQLR